MAIQKSYETSVGITCAAAYHRLYSADLNGEGKLVMHISSYNTAEDRDGGKEYVALRTYQAPYDPKTPLNLHTYAYDWLKTQPDFAGGTDV